MKFTQFSAIALLSFGMFTSLSTSADTVFGIYAGGGKWSSDYQGSAGDPAVTANQLGIDESDNSFFYVAIEHPIPVIPNIRYQQQEIQSAQSATLSDGFGLGDTDFPNGTQIDSDFDLSSKEATLYYELLDNWVNLDLGLTARQYDGYLYAEADSLGQQEKVDLDIVIPLLYAKFQFDLPLTGLSAAVETNFVKYQENRLMDYTAKISYLFDSVMDLGLEAGYKQLKLEVDDDDIQTNLTLKGPYVGALIHF
jgi:outer membrane protein